MSTTPLSYLELSKDNLLHNIKALRACAPRRAKISVAIKGDAYGHGQNEVAKILERHVDYFQLDGVEELRLIRKVSKKPVLMLGYIQKADLKETIKLGAVLCVYSLEQLIEISTTAEKLNKKQEVHLSIDAHLGREGIMPADLKAVLEGAQKLKYIKITGMYAHFANIEDTTNKTHAQKQIKEYAKAIQMAELYGYKKLIKHMSATSGLLVHEVLGGENNLIRLGIGVYGLWPSKNIEYMYQGKLALRPVLAWKSKIALVKTLPRGHTVGYGLTHMTYKQTKVAVVPQGYADGLDRRLSNNGEVLVRGTRCKIIGRVSMNMCTVDVTHLDTVLLEDEVVLLGVQGAEVITAEEIASKIGTINYEITTCVSSLLPRVMV